MKPTTTAGLVDSLAAAAHNLISGVDDLEQVLTGIVRTAVDTVPGADAAGLTLFTKGVLGSRAPFNVSVLKLDELQAELGQGPCIMAVSEMSLGGMVIVDDLAGADADRWPDFAARAGAYGYRSMCSTQLSTDGGPHAALNMYAHAPAAFDLDSQVVAGLFGVQAALVLYGADRARNLGIALGNRDTIGQAKGILMERFGVDGDHAFQMLVRSSQDTNLKLFDIARWLIKEGSQLIRSVEPLAGSQRSRPRATGRGGRDRTG